MRAALIGSAALPPLANAPYTQKIDATSPRKHLRLNEAGGAVATNRGTAAGDGTFVNTAGITYGLDPLVQDSDGGKSVGLSGSMSSTPHVTIDDLVTTATFTLDIAFQADLVKEKHVLITQGLLQANEGAVSLEVVEDGAGGLQLRQWTSIGGIASVWTTGAGIVPVGDACKIAYVQENGVGRRLYVDGVLVGERTVETTFAAPPAGTWYIGTWPTGIAPVDGCIAEVASWNRALAGSEIASLAVPESILYLGDWSLSLTENTSGSISPAAEAEAHPEVGFTTEVVSDGTLVDLTANGALLDYVVGDSAAPPEADSARVRLNKGALTSRTATIALTVTDVGAGVQLPAFGYQESTYVLVGNEIWWDPTNGNNSNSGLSKAQAKKTFAAAEALADTSKAIVVAGGAAGSTTWHASEEINPTKSGTSDSNRMRLVGEPGRTVVLCREGDFIGGVNGSWNWTTIDAGKKIYESPALGISDPATTVNFGSGESTGSGWLLGMLEIPNGSFGQPHFMWLPWVDTGRFTNSVGSNMRVENGGYAGPSVTSPGNGRVRVRLQPADPARDDFGWPTDGVMGGLIGSNGAWQEPSGTANDYRIRIIRFHSDYGGDYDVFHMDFRSGVDWWHIKGLNFDLAEGTLILSGNNGFHMEECSSFTPLIFAFQEQPTDNILFTRCQAITGDMRQLSWREQKTSNEYWWQHFRNALYYERSDVVSAGSVTFDRCVAFGWFDLAYFRTPSTQSEYKFTKSALLYIYDDGFVQDSAGGAMGLEVDHCFSFGGPLFSGGAGAPNTGAPHWYIHHSIIDLRIPELWNPMGEGAGWENQIGVGPNTMIPHGADGYRPWKFYYNTVITAPDCGKGLGRTAQLGPDDHGSNIPSAWAHEIFNNIVMTHASRRYPNPLVFSSRYNDSIVGHFSCQESTAGTWRLDYNLYHRDVPGTLFYPAFWEVQDSFKTGRVSYSSLAAFKASAHYTASASMYSDGTDGHEEHGVEADPMFVNLPGLDYRPQATGVVGAKNLTGTGWPGTGTFQDWKGAIDPSGSGNDVGPLAP